MRTQTTKSRPATRILLLLPVLLPACKSELFGGVDTHAEAVEQTDYAQQKIDAGPRQGDVWGVEQRDPSAEPIEAFCKSVSALPGGTAKGVACFPLVNLDLHDGAPWVSELGLGVADAVARTLGTTAGASVLGTDDLGVRLAERGIPRSSLTTLDAVAAAGHTLGADRVTFGTIRRRDRVGALDRDLLVCDLQAFDVTASKVVATAHWEIPSDDATLKQVWSLAQAESPWLDESRWEPRQHP